MLSLPTDIEFYYWDYDDGSSAGIVINADTDQKIASKLFDNKQDQKAYKNLLKTKYKTKQYELEMHELRISYGLDILKPRSTLDANTSQLVYFEFIAMLDSCGKDLHSQQTMMTFFSGLLAGFSARSLFNIIDMDTKIDPLEQRAPIFSVNFADNAFKAMKQIVASTCFPFTPIAKSKSDKHLHHKSAVIYPQKNSDRHLLDCSYTQFKNSKVGYHPIFPLQQRDTSVLINAKFFPGKEIFQYQQRNPWVSTILFCSQNRYLPLDPIRLDGNVFSRCNFEWKSDVLIYLFSDFSIFLAQSFNKEEKTVWYKEQILSAKQKIAAFNRIRGNRKIRGLQELWMIVQLVTLNVLLDFLDNQLWGTNTTASLRAKWFNLLLPVCIPLPKDTRSITEREIIIPKRDGRDLFEFALLDMLKENLDSLFPVVHPTELFPLEKDGIFCLGYFRIYRDNINGINFPSLQFNQKRFKESARQYCSISCNWQEIIKVLRDTPPPYLHPTQNARMPSTPNDNSSKSTIILNVEKMHFLPPHVQAYIQANLLNQGPELTHT